MKILITGANGLLGSDIKKILTAKGIDVCACTRNEFDITDRAQTHEYIKKCNPQAVIHCAAYTMVDNAEKEANLCMEVNTEGTRNIVEACKAIDAKIVCISSDYVFPGTKIGEYETEDIPNPINIYGKSKAEAEAVVKTGMKKHFIIRTSWIFGENGKNFVKSILRLIESNDLIRVVSDQRGSPTYSLDLAMAICDIVFTEKYGIYHITNEGFCSWAEFAEEIIRLSGKNTKVCRISSEEFNAVANRPKNSCLSKNSLDENGFKRLPCWQDALKRYINYYATEKRI